MNSAEDMLGYYTGKGLAWKWTEPLGRVLMAQAISKPNLFPYNTPTLPSD